MTAFSKELQEFIDQEDTILNNFPDILETPSFVEVSASIGTFNHVNLETLLILDDGLPGWSFVISDTGAISDTLLLEVGVTLLEIITLVDAIIANGTYNPSLLEIITTLDFVLDTRLYDELVTESPALTETIVNEVAILKELIENVFLSGTVVVIGDISNVLEENLSILDQALRFFVETISDSVSSSESIISLLTIQGIIADTGSLVEGLANLANLNEVITDTPSASDSVANIGNFFEILIDKGEILAFLSLDGQIFQCWVVTTDDFKLSAYSNFDFNSYATAKNKLFGTKSDGVYKIQGDNDAGTPFTRGVLYNFETLGDLHKKRFRKAYIGATGSRIVLRVQDGDGNTKYYEVKRKIAKIGKDLQSRRFLFALQGIDTLDHIDFHPLLLDKNR